MSYIGLLKKQGSEAGHILEDLKKRVDRPLAAILTLNTSAHTFGAAGVGAQVVELYGESSLAFVSVGLTLTMLYFTEMMPKTLGALYWKKLAPPCAHIIKYLIVCTYPFVVSFELFARLLSRGKKEDTITEDEIKITLEAGAQAGVIEEAEQDMVENIFRLADRHVAVLMIPRLDIKWINLSDSLDQVHQIIQESWHHYFPVCEGDLDKIVGIIRSKDLISQTMQKGKFDLKVLLRAPLFVNENTSVLQLISTFKKSNQHVAMVTDEYGNIQGLVTMNDVLNSIVKDILANPLEKDPLLIQLNPGSFLIDGRLPIDEFKALFHIDSLPEEERARYRTLGGFCMAQIGNIPAKDDSFEWGRFRFKILKMERHRVAKVLVHRL
ncbi:MAG: hypothetical protein K0S07_353 [Chlamydiales bacterium]|nr:hypothetical protein [Chlamydiales bacterium]